MRSSAWLTLVSSVDRVVSHASCQAILFNEIENKFAFCCSGLDYDHCFFRDENSKVVVSSTLENLNHRKVVQYDPQYADDQDAVAGHGTHVCG